jgi:hypothetical protein
MGLHVTAELPGPVVQHALAEDTAGGVVGAENEDVCGHVESSAGADLLDLVLDGKGF